MEPVNKLFGRDSLFIDKKKKKIGATSRAKLRRRLLRSSPKTILETLSGVSVAVAAAAQP